MVTASSDDFVSTTLQKVWLELDFLNTSTETAFRRVRMKADSSYLKRASKTDKDGNEFGWMAEIEGIVSDKPGKLRGNRCYRVFFEEAGNHPALIESYVQGRALVDILGFRVGSRIVFGTANGESNPKLAGLKRMFYNPLDFQMLPYKHNYTRNGDTMLTGYFIPSYTMWFGTKDNVGFDARGVVDEERAKAYYKALWDKISDPTVLIKDKAEYCFTPEDAFIMEGSNAFNMEKLSELQMNIDHNLVDKPKRVRFRWGLTKEGTVDRHSIPLIEYTDLGHTWLLEEPIRDNEGMPILNLYTIGCLPPGEKVLTDKGLKDIEKVDLDDKLFSIKGKPVNIINCQLYYVENEPIYKVKLNNIFSTTTFTKEHPIYCCTEKHVNLHGKQVSKTGSRWNDYHYDFLFKKMQNVKVGDFVKVPNVYKVEKPIPYDKWDESKIRTDRRIGNPLNNEDFWWLVGLILGDGWCASPCGGRPGGKIGIAFNAGETFYIEKTIRIIKEVFNRNVSPRLKQINSVEVLFDCLQFWHFFKDNFGVGAQNKNIPEWVKFLPANLKLNLLVGYFAADGCLCKNRDSYSAVSCSLKLLEDFQDIAFSIGLISTVHWLRSNEKTHYINHRTKYSVVRKAWTLDIHGDMINKIKRMYSKPDLKLDKWEYKTYTNHAIHRCFFEDDLCDYIYIKIASIEKTLYTGTVYNFHCETSTYMCHYIPTHNCDSIDTSADTTTGLTDLSKFCVVVYKRAFGLSEPRVVALYKFRPNLVTTAYDEAMKLTQYYGCKLLVEATRVGIIEYFRKCDQMSLLMQKPRSITSGKNARLYGCPADVKTIERLLQLINDYVENYYHLICFPEMVDELLRYSYENKRKFDIVAAFGIALLADEEMCNRPPKAANNKEYDTLGRLGYYKNEYGQVEFGIVPDKEPEDYGMLNYYGRY